MEVRGWGGNPPVHIHLSFQFDHVYMTGGVTRHMLPYLLGVPRLHVNRPNLSALETVLLPT